MTYFACFMHISVHFSCLFYAYSLALVQIATFDARRPH
jgi:hypothetical protein